MVLVLILEYSLDQLYTLSRVLEGVWESSQPVYMLCGFGEGVGPSPSGNPVGVFCEYGVPGPLVRAVGSPYESLLCNASSKPGLFPSWTLPMLPFVIDSVHNIHSRC